MEPADYALKKNANSIQGHVAADCGHRCGGRRRAAGGTKAGVSTAALWTHNTRPECKTLRQEQAVAFLQQANGNKDRN